MNKKVKNILSTLITMIILIVVGVIMIISFKGPNISIDEINNQLEISGLFYSKDIAIDDEVLIQIVSPKEILRRTNGSSIGDVKSGYFIIEGDLAVYLNLGDATLNWIEIINDDSHYYINLKTELETNRLYNDLISLLE